MDAHLNAMQYDANKLPLGKLSKSAINNGFAELTVNFILIVSAVIFVQCCLFTDLVGYFEQS